MHTARNALYRFFRRCFSDTKPLARSTFFIAIILSATLGITQGWAATPADTVIANTAAATYSINGIGAYSATSNTVQFAVEKLDVNDSAIMSVVQTPNNLTPSAGDTLSFDVNITNTGDNTLADATLNITIPQGSSMTFSAPALATPLSVNSYSLSDLPPFETLTIQLNITLPPDIVPGPYTLDFEYVANALSLASSQIPITVKGRTVAVMDVLRYDTNATTAPLDISVTDSFDGSGYLNIPVPTLPDNVTLVTDQPLPLTPATEFMNKQTLFVKIADADHDRDPLARDSVEVTFTVEGSSETEIIRLKETAVGSGVFSGYMVMSYAIGGSYDGSLNVSANDRVNVAYRDEVEDVTSDISILVDPYGVIFDSENGIALDGFTVRLVNAATGLDAEVYGEDGISTYPATLTSGGSTTDSSGTLYNFDTGAYRFPLVTPGEYYLEVTPPALSTYHFPSAKTDTELASTSGGPFAIDIGSRGENFTVAAGPPLHLDIPADPLTSILYIQRSASKETLEQGDFLQYRVTLENTSALAALNNTILNDTLPQGFRYRSSSTKINNLPAADPQISADGRTLSFDLGALAATSIHEVRYVVEVAAAKAGQAASISIANANGGAIVSNTARVKTNVKDAFMRSANLLAGRVLIHDENGNFTGEGIPGVRIYMENGTYTVTDEKGRYHFEGVTSGTHVLQLDLDTLPEQYEAMAFEKNTRFAGRSWSRFVDLQGGTLWRADFHISKKPAPKGLFSLQFTHDKPAKEDQVQYRIQLNNKTVPLSNVKLILMMPENMHYQPNTTRFGDQTLNDPVVQDNMLTYRLGSIKGDLSSDLTFTIKISDRISGSYIAKAMLIFDTPAKKAERSTILQDILERRFETQSRKRKEVSILPHFDAFSTKLRDEDIKALDMLAEKLKKHENIKMSVFGYSDNKKIRHASRHIHKNNQALSAERAMNVAQYLKEKLHLTPEQIMAKGNGKRYSVADNSTEEGRAANRRARVIITSDIVEISIVDEDTQPKKKPLVIETVGTNLPLNAASPSKLTQKNVQKVTYDDNWLTTARPGLEWLLPIQNDLPAIASSHISIKHNKGQKIKLMLNGAPVPPVNFDSTTANKKGVAISRWRGVDLIEGDNRFVAYVSDKNGKEIERLERRVHYSTPPVHADLVKEASVLIADGITPPVIALRLSDKTGYPARRNIIGNYSLNSPYLPQKTGDFDPSVLPGAPEQKLKFTVEGDGLVKITLEPTSQSGEVQLTLPLMNGDRMVKARLVAPKRDWIVVGFAEGTIGHNTLSGKTEDLQGNAGDKDIYSDGKVAFFAKGQVKGEWLLTMAFDSEKKTGEKDSSLFGSINPEKYYTVYGDTSAQGFEAASREKLYLKLESDEFYLLFGDYNTNLNGTRLSSYTRALTGLKSEYHDETYDVVLFGSESNQAFIHDEIRGKGMTGPYSLSRQNILLNSEEIVLETRDRFHSENVLESRKLNRHSDYQIDYIKGTVTFRETVYEHDSGLNNIFIVAKYESFDEDDLSMTYGGRVGAKVHKNVEVGLTHVSEGRTGGEAELTGADATLNVTDNTLIRAEIAHSRTRDSSADSDGTAFLAEIEHRGEKFDAKAYAQKTDGDFGMGQSAGARNGTEKAGVESNYRLSERLSLSGSAFEQRDTETKAKRDVIEAKTNLQIEQNSFSVGARTARDKRGDGTKEQSDQIIVGASRRMMENKLKLSVDHEHSMGSADNIDYPTVTRAGADYLLSKETSVFAQREWADGANRKTETTQLGLKTTPWEGGSLFTGVTQTQGTGSDTTSANAALTQKWKINDLWSMDFGAENSKTLRSESPPLDSDVPYAHGSSSDYTAGSVGVTYNPKTWIWNARVEQRHSDLDDTWLAVTSLQTDPSSETSLLTSLRLYDSQGATGLHRNNGELRADLAYRPLMGPWIILDKLQLIKETNTGGDFEYENRRIINSTNANYLAINKWQLAMQLGLKYVQEYIDQTAYNGVTNLYGAEARYDITEDWDVGTHFSVLHGVESSQFDGHAGLSLGHSFMKNVWVSLGYNFVGFYDRDFSQGRSTSQGVYMKFRIKFDQESLKRPINKLFGAEQ